MTDTEAQAEGRTERPVNLLPLTFAVAAVVILVDQLTKHWAVTNLDPDEVVHVIWTLQWNLSFNSGMAFSRGRGLGPIIGLIAIVIVVFIVLSVRTNASKLVAVAAGLVMGGAIGNLLDRVFRGDGWLHGSVVDFIDFQWFPIFNVADICVNVGGALFIIWSLFAGRSAPSTAPGGPS
ncbi:MAG: signal peptidase II [Ilumatobacteraceae bacterium]|jgi:signal peptidase II